MKKRKILYITGTRADYGLMRETLLQIQRNPKLRLDILACGMHLMPEFGNTIKEIEKDNFKIHLVKAVFRKDDRTSVPDFIGNFTLKITNLLKKIKPDIILLLGDRPEMLVGAMEGAYLTIPVAHIHGGELSFTIDELTRHAITKFSHIHFAVTRESARRIKKLGEDSWRVFLVGAPGLDSVLNTKLFSEEKIAKKYKLDLTKPLILVLQHPITSEIKEASRQIKETMEAIKELSLQTIVIYPNADPGGRAMIKVIKKYKKYPFIKIYTNLPHKDYLSLMKVARVMVGNSSSGIIEAPSFHLPAVNVGKRQIGRERTGNVIDVDYKKDKIKKAIKKAIFDEEFRGKVKKCKNPYGDGRAGSRIAGILAKIKIDKELLEKQLNY